MKKILFVASESAPFVKTGGLGSVLGSLPKEFNKNKYDVRLVIPGYECIPEQWHKEMKELYNIPVNITWRHHNARIMEAECEGVTCYFIKNDLYFSGSAPYSDIWMDIEKFAFFSKAVLEMLSYLDFEPDIIHCHDWQTGLLPVYLKTMYSYNPFYNKIKTVMTIHNMKFQGICDIDRMKDLTGLPDEAFAYDILEHYNNANMLKGGISCADYVSTVSKTYAEEILDYAFGEGLSDSLWARKDNLYGIVNGIDYDMYNPSTDQSLKNTYDIRSYRKARRENKLALQEASGLRIGEDIFTMGIVSRLTEQKGYDLLYGVLDDMMAKGAEIFVLGGGEQQVMDMFYHFRDLYPDQVYFNPDYNDTTAKMIYGGCDVTLMPSRFEPCGLNQLMALRYGCVPIVRSTGGLSDTVSECDAETETGTGFTFTDFTAEAFKEALNKALHLYQTDTKAWNALIRRGMKENYSWKKSAKAYEKLYNQLMK